jgi:hypothetical protein
VSYLERKSEKEMKKKQEHTGHVVWALQEMEIKSNIMTS